MALNELPSFDGSETDKPKRILFVSNSIVNPNAGTEGQLLQLLKHLPKDRYKPELLVFSSSDYIRSGEIPCTVHVLGSSSLFRLSTWYRFLRFVRNKKREGIKLAHMYFHDASIIGPPVFHMYGIRSIISRRDMGYWYTSLYQKILRITGRYVDRVVVNSEAVAEVTVKKEGISRERMRVIYNGYESPLEYSGFSTKAYTIDKQNGPIIFLVANIRPLKRIGDAIVAVKNVIESGRSIQLVIVGGGCSGELKSLASKHEVLENIHFLGPYSDVKEILHEGYAGLLCSESEGYSNSIVEYMQAGLPVIASDTGGNREAVVDSETGWRYPVGDIPALTDRLQRLVDDPSLAHSFGVAGKRLAVERHSLENMIAQHLYLYDAIVEKPARNVDV